MRQVKLIFNMKIKLQDTYFKHTWNKDARTQSSLYRMYEAGIGWPALKMKMR